ncbi:MAG: bifunctional adenosylcobinamide kinase/adenosylcobinamide-phosphate guanylyltransferase [Deltaproteobacteria bacterium]|nr:bifunctional adenosylcobinamide kinase/adenosylcobinamide-phosphate guanylyltransferase [Deltaproteobacteria bacterium]MBZ0220218.1 bifunctional adenosylcobinamide kinase/adenosylcobinamide-phosphate guanylyltransferase [Deltaproteobacteria bacterium]
MPGRFSFVIGGARSGKSAFALGLASNLPGRKVFIATAEAFDQEMDERIRKHKEERGAEWETVEEKKSLRERVESLGPECAVVIDCLTLWITNLLSAGLSDKEILDEAGALARACKESGSSVVAVSNEVGLGIVPDNALARRFRDLSGAVNKEMASSAKEVWFLAAGLPLRMK